jgi:hypothetical protein
MPCKGLINYCDLTTVFTGFHFSFFLISMLSGDVPKECASWHNLAGGCGEGEGEGGNEVCITSGSLYIRFMRTPSSGVCIGPTQALWNNPCVAPP